MVVTTLTRISETNGGMQVKTVYGTIQLEPIIEAPPGAKIPPIPGILVIPGNIAFLNQFFSVFLTV
jgi:hypothetical protein